MLDPHGALVRGRTGLAAKGAGRREGHAFTRFRATPKLLAENARVAIVLRFVSAGLGILFLVAGVADVLRRTPWGILGAIGGVLILVGVVMDLRRERRERQTQRRRD